MSQLIVRNVEPEVVRALKLRAASNGRSAEAEHRAILCAAVSANPQRSTLKQALAGMPDVGSDADFARERDRGRRTTL